MDGRFSTNIFNAEWMDYFGVTVKELRECSIVFKGAVQEQFSVLGVWENVKVTV